MTAFDRLVASAIRRTCASHLDSDIGRPMDVDAVDLDYRIYPGEPATVGLQDISARCTGVRKSGEHFINYATDVPILSGPYGVRYRSSIASMDTLWGFDRKGFGAFYELGQWRDDFLVLGLEIHCHTCGVVLGSNYSRLSMKKHRRFIPAVFLRPSTSTLLTRKEAHRV